MCMQLQLVTKEVIDLKQSREECMGEFGERRGKGKLCNYIIMSKINRIQQLQRGILTFSF